MVEVNVGDRVDIGHGISRGESTHDLVRASRQNVLDFSLKGIESVELCVVDSSGLCTETNLERNSDPSSIRSGRENLHVAGLGVGKDRGDSGGDLGVLGGSERSSHSEERDFHIGDNNITRQALAFTEIVCFDIGNNRTLSVLHTENNLGQRGDGVVGVTELEGVCLIAIQSTTDTENVLSIGVVLPAGLRIGAGFPRTHGTNGQKTAAVLRHNVVAGSLVLGVEPIGSIGSGQLELLPGVVVVGGGHGGGGGKGRGLGVVLRVQFTESAGRLTGGLLWTLFAGDVVGQLVLDLLVVELKLVRIPLEIHLGVEVTSKPGTS
mmetsp:Transcript_51789/g.113026  ORF Transcript_51789/g.113026 Transcript_51789/m.113026 type:complete len:321 (-) Transcript_51789:1528-2490(-)